MNEIISIYDAKTHLSKLVKQAQAGKTIYIGAYGRPQAILQAVPKRQPLHLGIWKNKYPLPDYEALKSIEAEIANELDGKD